MASQLRIAVDHDEHAGEYAFRAQSGRREFTSRVSASLASSFFEDVRLLRWKSAKIRNHNDGDTLLNHVGERLARIIAASTKWKTLQIHGPQFVRICFSQAALRLMPFPWELLRVDSMFLIGDLGSHLVREIPAKGHRVKRRNRITNVVHITLGTDSALRFDEERCILLESIPSHVPIEFLIDPSPEHIWTVLDAYRPHVVIVSGHGHYDDLQGEHLLSANLGRSLRTEWLVELCAKCGCRVLILSSCESARIGRLVFDEQKVAPPDVIAFTFPVKNTTAMEGLRTLVQEIFGGKSINDAMTAVRAIESEDEYAFFNTVHFHRYRARLFQLSSASTPCLRAFPARCAGLDLPLSTLNALAHGPDDVAVVAPVGGGGDQLLKHWAELMVRSQGQANRWNVTANERTLVNVPGAQSVRLVYPHSFSSFPAEKAVYCDGMDKQLAFDLLAEWNQQTANSVREHPLLGIPGFVSDLSAGMSEEAAVNCFESQNKMPERAKLLNGDGMLFASWLFSTESVAATSFRDRTAYSQSLEGFGMSAETIVSGIENSVESGVVLDMGEVLALSPDFMLLGTRWFPSWQSAHRETFEFLAEAFFILAEDGKIDIAKAGRLLEWAIRLGEWHTAVRICIQMCGWYGDSGRLEEAKPLIESLLPHSTSMSSIVLRGHLTVIAINNGEYKAGLCELEKTEAELETVPKDDDYVRNLYATLTQQVDCLRMLDRVQEAKQRWKRAYNLLPQLKAYRLDAEVRLLGQLAHIRCAEESYHDAVRIADEAVGLAERRQCAPNLIDELRHTKAEMLRQDGREVEALAELNLISENSLAPSLLSRVLHLKALLMGGEHSALAIETLLESYEQDRLRGDRAGVAISLLTIARIFLRERDYERARSRIKEAVPLADACGLTEVLSALADLRATIDAAEAEGERQ